MTTVAWIETEAPLLALSRLRNTPLGALMSELGLEPGSEAD
jgi:hypothetical protein